MGRRLIEVMQVLADQVHKGGYQHRVLEDSIYKESQKRIAAEKDRDHWKQARQDAHEAGELMQAEIASLRQQLAEAQQPDVTMKEKSVAWGEFCAPVADTAERERLANLVRFVEHVREFLSKNNSYITYADINGVRNALRSLDYQNPKVDVTAEGGT